MDRVKNIISNLIGKLKFNLDLSKDKNVISVKNYQGKELIYSNVVDLKLENSFNVKYLKNPEVFYIENHIDNLYNDVYVKFSELEYVPKIGIEAEFYALNVLDKKEFYDFVMNFSTEKQIDLNRIKSEEGQNQFELEFSPYFNIKKLIFDFNILKKLLLESKYSVIFNAKPFYQEVGSSLQINITLNDKDGKNLFAKNKIKGIDDESNILKNAVAGLLEKTNSLLSMYIKSEDCLVRYDLEFNKIYFSMGKIPAPTCNSWGINNRTCSIRIPIPKNQISIEKYQTEDQNNRRIEFRVPSSDCNIKHAIFGVLYSILYGIENQLEPIEPTNNNVFEQELLYKSIENEF